MSTENLTLLDEEILKLELLLEEQLSLHKKELDDPTGFKENIRKKLKEKREQFTEIEDFSYVDYDYGGNRISDFMEDFKSIFSK